MFNSPAGGAGELFSSPAKGFVDASGGGSGLDQAAVQALIDTSLSGAVAPSSVTSAGAIKSGSEFTFDDGEGTESEVAKISNGGLAIRRGSVNFLTCALSGVTLGVNTTCSLNLTVNGLLTPSSQGIAGYSTTAAINTLLAQKQALLSDNDGTGVTLRDNTVMRRAFGAGGISVTVPLNLAN